MIMKPMFSLFVSFVICQSSLQFMTFDMPCELPESDRLDVHYYFWGIHQKVKMTETSKHSVNCSDSSFRNYSPILQIFFSLQFEMQLNALWSFGLLRWLLHFQITKSINKILVLPIWYYHFQIILKYECVLPDLWSTKSPRSPSVHQYDWGSYLNLLYLVMIIIKLI